MAEKLEIIIGAKDQFSKTMGSLRSMLPSIKTLAISAGAAVGGLGAGLFAIANSTAKAGSELQKMSLRLGIGTDALGEYHHAAEMSGVSTETFNMAMQRMVRRIAEAAQGTGEAVDALKELGMPIKDLAAMKPDEQFEKITEAMQGTETQADRVRLAMKLFDSEGVKLVQMMGNGVEGLNKFREEAKALGITFDQVGADQSAEFRDNLLRIQRIFTGIKTQIGQAIIPIFSEWAGIAAEAGKKIVGYVRQNKDAIKDYAETFVTSIGTMAKIGSYGVAVLIDSWRGLKMIWQILKIAFYEFIEISKKGIYELQEALLAWYKILGKDEAIERLIYNMNNTAITIGNVALKSELAKQALKDLIEQPLAFSQVGDAISFIEKSIEELRAAAGANGIPPFDDENVDRTKGNIEKVSDAQQGAIDALRKMWEEYFLTESERIDIWYLEQQEKFAGHREALNDLDQIYLAKQIELGLKQTDERIKAEEAANSRIKTERMNTLQNLANIGLIFGKKGLMISRMLAIPHAIIATRDAAISAYKAMAGIPIIGPALGVIAAAAATAYGMKQVGLIKAQTAHTGLTSVPSEQAYVLAERERVISAPQNRDLTEFLAGQQVGNTIEQFNTFNVLPNAGNVESLLQMSRRDWQNICEDKIVPALRSLKIAGIAA